MIKFHQKAVIVLAGPALGFAFSLSLSACNYDVSKGGAPSSPGPAGAPGSGSEPAPQSQLSFDYVLQNAIRSSCFDCHKSPRNAAGLNLETYEEVFSRLGDIEQAVASKYMPESKGRVMPDDQRKLLLDWIAAGLLGMRKERAYENANETWILLGNSHRDGHTERSKLCSHEVASGTWGQRDFRSDR